VCVCWKELIRPSFSNLFADTLTMASTTDSSVRKRKLWSEESMMYMWNEQVGDQLNLEWTFHSVLRQFQSDSWSLNTRRSILKLYLFVFTFCQWHWVCEWSTVANYQTLCQHSLAHLLNSSTVNYPRLALFQFHAQLMLYPIVCCHNWYCNCWMVGDFQLLIVTQGHLLIPSV